jgi:hypothetical protein
MLQYVPTARPENESHFPYSTSLTLKRTPYVYSIMMCNWGKDGAATAAAAAAKGQ